MSIFGVTLENELKKRGLSHRAAARQMGISHTTLYAAQNGARSMDIGTALSIARWMGVPLSTLIDEAASQEDAEANKICQALRLVFEASPEVEQIFRLAASALDVGVLTLEDFQFVTEFVAWKIEKRLKV